MGITRKTRHITREQAEAAVGAHLRCELRIIARSARLDARIAELKAKLADDIAADQAESARARATAEAYILANKDELLSGRRHTVATTMGTYGLRKNTETVIEDAEAVLDYARDNGYPDLYKEGRTTVVKKAVAKRLKDGEEVPGARISTDYEPSINPARTLVDQARAGTAPAQ